MDKQFCTTGAIQLSQWIIIHVDVLNPTEVIQKQNRKAYVFQDVTQETK